MIKIVNVTNLDGVRIEVLGEGRAVTIPAGVILALDRVLRYCLLEESGLELDMVEDDRTGWQGWEATCEHPTAEDVDTMLHAHGDTPWGALAALADALERAR